MVSHTGKGPLKPPAPQVVLRYGLLADRKEGLMARTAQTDVTSSTPAPALYVALELSKATWKLGFTTSRTQRAWIRDVPARDKAGFLAEIEKAKKRFGLAPDTVVRSCYEAGRDGFWIHRFLEGNGIENVILDPASIEVDRRARRAKTDRLDVQKLAQLLVRHHDGEGVVRIVRVPPLEAEDERLLPRQLRRIKRTRLRLTNAIRAGLIRHGVDLDPRKPSFCEELAAARQWDGKPLAPGQRQELEFLWEQRVLVERQIKQLAQTQRTALREARRGAPEATVAERKAARLTELRGVGDVGAYVLTTEFFAWRQFRNRKEISALAGLTGTPFSSGSDTDGTPQKVHNVQNAGSPVCVRSRGASPVAAGVRIAS